MGNTKEVTLPVSGRVVTVQRPLISSVALITDYQTKHPMPRPPMQEVKLMGKAEWVENIAHPDYPRARQEWYNERHMWITNVYLNLGVLTQPDEDDAVAIDQTRAMLGDMLSDLTDQQVFIKYVLIQGEEDFTALSDAILEMLQPTEGQIADNTARFRRAV